MRASKGSAEEEALRGGRNGPVLVGLARGREEFIVEGGDVSRWRQLDDGMVCQIEWNDSGG